MTYLFVLGRESLLSLAEIHHYFLAENISYETIYTKYPFVIFDIASPFDAEYCMKQLGGTMKIGRWVANTPAEEALITYLQHIKTSQKIHFSVSGDVQKNTGIAIKKQLKQLGYSVRYVEPKNTATILHNNLVKLKTDCTVFRGSIFVTEAIQPIEELSARDYGRPGTDSKSGMLPPKLAKMLINLCGIKKNHQHAARILDPFCGSGTLIMEAFLMGYTHLVGRDLSETAIVDTKKNINWVIHSSQKEDAESTVRVDVGVQDVQTLSESVEKNSIDAIVTEPFMGKPLHGTESKMMLEKQANELSTLYIAAFQSFVDVLKKNAVVVMIIPKFLYGKEWITIDCQKDILALGFAPVPLLDEHVSLVYHRPKQFVAREIWKYKKLS